MIEDSYLVSPRQQSLLSNSLDESQPTVDNEAFWRRLLRGFTTPTQLPGLSSHFSGATDSQTQTKCQGVQHVQLSVATTDKLQSVAKQHQLSLNTIVQGAWALLLGRLGGQDDVVFGVVRDCRHSVLEGMESMMGPFANTVPVRVRVESDLPLLSWLQQLRSLLLAMRDYEHTSLMQIQEWSELPEGTRLFESLVMFEPGQHQEFAPVEQIDYPLSLVAHAGSQLLLKLHYDGQRFDEQTIQRMLGQLTTLLEGIAAAPEQNLGDLPLLTTAERHQLLVEWNDTHAHIQPACLHQLFEAQVERTPDAVAVVFKDQQLTYRELNTRANKLAHHLQSLGVAPEVLVGICVERSLEMIVGLFGILKAGGAYVPLDPKYPVERLADIISDAQVSVLLTQWHLLEKLPLDQARVVAIEKHWQEIEQHSVDNPTSTVKPDNLAYAIYTSGSTGKPKGVAIEHRGAVNTIIDINQRFNVGAEDRVLAVSSLSFDLSVYDVFGLLACGGAIVIPEPSMAPNPAHWLELMRQEQVTIWNSAPPVMQLFMGYVAYHSDTRLPALRLVMLSGDWIPLSLPNQIKAVGENIQVISLGGATEASIWSIYYPIETVEPTWRSIPYGRPLANQQFHVLDAKLQPVPIGVVGELYIGGAGLARCYLNRPDLTEAKFIPNPLSQEPGSRLYKTGDLGRYLPDGNIEFLGRLDHQVKIRGFRIELGEIEAVLTQHSMVREALVIAREDLRSDKYLAAYIVPHPDRVPSSFELRDFLKTSLPDYMVPSAFVVLDALPLSPNGKIDRKALPIPESTIQEVKNTFVAPQDELQLQLAQIWENVLGIQPIGIRDNFFELGGHSLLAATLWSQIEKLTGKSLPLATLFQAPTIEQLSQILRQEQHSPSCPSLMVIQPGGSKPPLFCIHVLGRGLEFYRPLAQYLDPEQPMYGLSTQIAAMDETQAPPNRVEDLAAFYIQQMQILQPEGPYFLAGVSFGGEVAFEMARQLVAQGHKVALVALFDTLRPGAIKYLPTSQRLSVHLDNFCKRGPIYILEKVNEKLKGPLDQLKMRLNRIYCKLYNRIGRPLPDDLVDFTYRELNTQASATYVPQVYPGQVTLFRARERPDAGSASTYLDPELGWGGLAAGGLEIHEADGDHLGMLKEPHVRVLGEKFKACLAQALTSSKSASKELQLVK